MKKLILLLGFLPGCISLLAQENTTGTVVYEQTVKIEIKLDGEAAQLMANLPKERKSLKVLYFNDRQSLYENGKSSAQDDISSQSGGANVMIKMAEPDNKIFTDFAGKSQLEMREFMTRVFLIDRTPDYKWKITGNQKIIREYPCQEATLTDGEKKVTAWFTPAIPVPAGPGTYAGLPGLILELDLDGGKNVIAVKSIDLAPVADGVIVKPDKGKKVTKEEFDQIVAEKVKEMGGQVSGNGSGATFMIRIQK